MQVLSPCTSPVPEGRVSSIRGVKRENTTIVPALSHPFTVKEPSRTAL